MHGFRTASSCELDVVCITDFGGRALAARLCSAVGGCLIEAEVCGQRFRLRFTGSTDDAVGVRRIEPIDNRIGDKGMLSEGDAFDFADLEGVDRQVIGGHLGVDNLHAPDTQLVLTGEVHDDGFKQSFRIIVLVNTFYLNSPPDGDAK